MRKKHIILFFTITIIGLLTWTYSTFLFGTSEPWDSPNYGLVSLALLIIGLLFGLVGYEKPLTWAMGFYLGSFLYGTIAFMKDIFFYSGGGVNLFLPLGMIFLIPFCFPVLLGSFVGSFVMKRYRKVNK